MAASRNRTYPTQQCEPFPLGQSLLLQEGILGCESFAAANVTVDPHHQTWWPVVQESTNRLRLRFGSSDYRPAPSAINPATALPFMSQRNRAIAPKFEKQQVNSQPMEVLSFDGSKQYV